MCDRVILCVYDVSLDGQNILLCIYALVFAGGGPKASALDAVRSATVRRVVRDGVVCQCMGGC